MKKSKLLDKKEKQGPDILSYVRQPKKEKTYEAMIYKQLKIVGPDGWETNKETPTITQPCQNFQVMAWKGEHK